MTSSPEGEGGVSRKMTNDDMMTEGGHYGLTGHAIKMSKCLKNSGNVLKTQARS